MWREWKTEWIKVRYRKISLVLLAFLGLTLAWLAWIVRDGHPEEIADGYRWVLFNASVINTVLLPAMVAMLASRLYDTELKGNTFKLLCTMERPGRLFDMKLLMGVFYLGIYMAAELGAFFLLGRLLHFGNPLSARHILCFLAENYLVSIAVLLLQQVLSLFYENQIIPLAAGLFGSFVGLFAWFFEGSFFRRFFLWGYYPLLMFLGSTWDEDTRIMSFYDIPVDKSALATLLAVVAAGYFAGKYLFVKHAPGCR